MTSARKFGRFEFAFGGEIIPHRINNEIFSEQPSDRYSKKEVTPLNQYGAGPFGIFKIAKLPKRPGLYIVVKGYDSMYVGETFDLNRRWGASGYGRIQPRNCFRGGQETNCRVNALMLQVSMQNERLALFVCLEADRNTRLAYERELILALKPPWNR